MGFNFTGLAISKNFDKSPEQLFEFLDLSLEYEGEIDFQSGSGYKDEGYFDVFFSDTGTLIYGHEPLQISEHKSKDCSILTFMVSETAMTFYFALDENGERVKEIVDNEGDKQNLLGGEVSEEEKEENVLKIIVKEKEKIFGHNFYSMHEGAKGFRYKTKAHIEAEPIQNNTKTSTEEEPFSYKAPFYDSGTVASNPGKMKMNYLQYGKMNFFKVLERLVFLIVAYLFMTKIHWLFFIVFLIALVMNVWFWYKAQMKFKAGDVNPGKVLSVNPDRVAVYTNMLKFGGDYPIIRIIETKLPKFEKEIGAFIPTVALYNDNPHDYPFWAEFHPEPVSHGVSNRSELKGRLESFAEEDFRIIDTYMKEINTYEVGTYKVNIENSSWKDYPHVELGNLSSMKGPDEADQ
ncbi:MAG: hypothetical protein P1U56_02985 [Saprospiraceae bacterium]|nr:hypothetical protein [Saprospiraceae bacterium]